MQLVLARSYAEHVWCNGVGHQDGGREPGDSQRRGRLRLQQQQDAYFGRVWHEPDHPGHRGELSLLILVAFIMEVHVLAAMGDDASYASL